MENVHRPHWEEPSTSNTDIHMKINSPMVGKGSGKLGSTVMASIAGETIARQYNPNVANPNTEAQQNTRSRFKLLSQLGAVYAPYIAIRKQGLTSARNIFTSINFEHTSFNSEEAMIDLNRIQLTNSPKSMIDFSVDRTSKTSMAVNLMSDARGKYDRVVYCAFEKTEMGEIIALGSAVVSTPGDNGRFSGTLPYTESAVVVYAYGISDVLAGITTKFGNLQTPTADQVARLITASADNMSSVIVTRTKGLTMLVGENTKNSAFEPVEMLTLSVSDTSILNTVQGTIEISGYSPVLRGSYSPDDALEIEVYNEHSTDGEDWVRGSRLSVGVNGSFEQGFSWRNEWYYRTVIYQQGIRVYVSQIFRYAAP